MGLVSLYYGVGLFRGPGRSENMWTDLEMLIMCLCSFGIGLSIGIDMKDQVIRKFRQRRR